jgi:ATPase subunit of ABC transporter with duplicated ATPase domains
MSIPEEVKVPEQPQTTPGISPENDINWKNFREQRAAERKQAEEARAAQAKAEKEASALKAAMEALLQKPAPVMHQDEELEETEAHRIKRLVKEEMEEERRKDREERLNHEKKQLKPTLEKAYSDFDTVCSSENLDYLEFHYPEVVAGYKNAPDTFDKWSNIYKAAKRFIPNTDS